MGAGIYYNILGGWAIHIIGLHGRGRHRLCVRVVYGCGVVKGSIVGVDKTQLKEGGSSGRKSCREEKLPISGLSTEHT